MNWKKNNAAGINPVKIKSCAYLTFATKILSATVLSLIKCKFTIIVLYLQSLAHCLNYNSYDFYDYWITMSSLRNITLTRLKINAIIDTVYFNHER